MRLREFIHPAVTCDPQTTLADAADMMDRSNVGSLVIVNPKGRILGIITDRDLALRGYGRDLPSTTAVDEIMTRQVLTMRDTADVFDAATEMAHTGCRRLPVVDAQGMLRGILALDDLTVLFARQAEHLAQAVELEGNSDWGP